MPINFASAKPGIEMFNANVARGNQERHAQGQEDRAFEDQAMRQAQYQQTQGADAAIRNIFAEILAKRNPAAAPVPTTTFQPTPVADPLPVAPAGPMMPPAQAPASNAVDQYGAGEFGSDPRLPPAQPAAQAPVPVQPAPTGPAAAPVAGAPAPAARAPAGRTGGDMNALMTSMAKAPGTGKDLLHLFGTERQSERTAAVEERKIHQEGLRIFLDASSKNDVATMTAVAKQYGLGIPDGVLNDRKMMAEIASQANVAKSMGLTDDTRALAYAKGSIHAKAAGMNITQAHEAGLDEARKVEPGFKATHWDHAPDGEVVGFDSAGNQKRTGFKARQPRYADGSGGGRAPGASGESKQTAHSEWRIRTLVASGKPLAEAQAIVAGGTVTRPITQQQRMTQAQNLMKQTDPRTYRKLYNTFDEALAAVDAANSSQGPAGGENPDDALNRQFRAPGAGGAPAPAAGAPAGAPAAAGAPRMRFDAQGNQIGG